MYKSNVNKDQQWTETLKYEITSQIIILWKCNFKIVIIKIKFQNLQWIF